MGCVVLCRFVSICAVSRRDVLQLRSVMLLCVALHGGSYVEDEEGDGVDPFLVNRISVPEVVMCDAVPVLCAVPLLCDAVPVLCDAVTVLYDFSPLF
jgi:hypothetical protein